MRGAPRIMLLGLALAFVACGPSARNAADDDDDDNSTCQPGSTSDCYDGADGTEGVGPCHAGTRVCGDDSHWGSCSNEVVPVAENCTDGVDNNCNGQVDEDVDEDGDGFTSCGGGDCCDSTAVCSNPTLVNPGAFDAPGNGVDDDCDGIVDNTTPVCDTGLASNSSDAMDYAKAIDLCQTATMADKKWGVISATFTKADGTGTPASKAHSIRPHFGSGVTPKVGSSLMEISTGAAAAEGDTNPAYEDLEDGDGAGGSSDWPSDFISANGGMLPNAPGCPAAESQDCDACDPVMLTLTIRVPTNASSFSINSNFFSSEFPEYVCSPFNDFFVMLLDSTWSGTPANPSDKNLAFYQPMNSADKYPVGVNLAYGNTGLFTQCESGQTGCDSILYGGHEGTITCTGTDELAGTGLDTAGFDECNQSDEGGGTGWLSTTGNVVGGEIIKLRIALWNTSDHALQSLAVIDGFQWSVEASDPGTVIGRTEPTLANGKLTVPLHRNASYLQ
ncbi:MAG TPA: MopE-related protein [Kofleriaceae bacterium]